MRGFVGTREEVGAFSRTYGSYGRDKLRDIVNALAAYQGKPLMEHDEISAAEAAHGSGDDAVLDGRTIAWQSRYKAGEYQTRDRGLTIRKFGNGMLMYSSRQALLDINQGARRVLWRGSSGCRRGGS